MLDINLLRNDLAARRGRAGAGAASTLDTARFEALEAERKDIQTRTQELQAAAQRARRSRSASPRAKGEDAAPLLAEVAGLGDELKALEAELDARAGASCATSCSMLPNLPHAEHAGGHVGRRQRRGAPLGHAARRSTSRRRTTPTSARRSGCSTSRPRPSSPARASRFLRGDLARLHRALAQFMLDVAHARARLHRVLHAVHRQRRDAGRHDAAAEVRGRHVRGDARAAQQGEEALYLISTSEITLTNIVRDEILACRVAADQADRAHAVLPLRGGQLRQGHARHDPPAPVRQGRARADRRIPSARTRRSRS